jgi:WD40 repeat protein
LGEKSNWYQNIPGFSYIKTCLGVDSEIRCLAVNRAENNNYFYCGSKSGKVYGFNIDLDHNKPIFELHEHTDSVTSLKTDSTGRYLLSASKDGTIIIWDLLENKLFHRISESGKKIYIINLTSANNFLFFGGEDEYLTICQINHRTDGSWLTIESKMKLLGPIATIHSIIFDDTERFCYAAGDNENIYCWDWKKEMTQDLEPLRIIPAHLKRIFQLVNNSTANTFLSLGEEKKIHFWDQKELTLIKEIQSPKSCVHMIPNSDQNIAIALTINNHLLIWNMKNWTLAYDIPIQEGQMGILGGNSKKKLIILSSFGILSHPIWIWNLTS